MSTSFSFSQSTLFSCLSLSLSLSPDADCDSDSNSENDMNGSGYDKDIEESEEEFAGVAEEEIGGEPDKEEGTHFNDYNIDISALESLHSGNRGTLKRSSTTYIANIYKFCKVIFIDTQTI